MDEQRKCFLYFIKQDQTDLIKIGISIDPLRRLAEIVNMAGFSAEIVNTIEYPSTSAARSVETNLHRLFECSRVNGEWFKNINLNSASGDVLNPSFRQESENTKRRRTFNLSVDADQKVTDIALQMSKDEGRLVSASEVVRIMVDSYLS